MSSAKEFQAVFERHKSYGGQFWSRADGDIHAPYGFSTIDTLSVLGEAGLTINDHPLITEAVDFVFSYQNREGSFRYSLKSSNLPCLTARIIAAFGRLGISNDEKIEKSYRWLLDTQWNDGGWRCPMIKLGKSPLTDASNPGTTLYVLDAFRFRANQPDETIKLNKGVDFLLQHWEVRQPVGPCGFGIGTRFLKIEYPFLRYNIFYYVYILSFYKKARKDKRFQEAYTFLAGKSYNGNMIPENPHRAWQGFDFAKKRQVSSNATKRWLEMAMNLKKNI
jgi:hypothetical protein